MAIRAVFFDVGETLVDEERYWREMARAAGVGPQVVWAALGKTIERGEEHWELWRHLGLERPAAAWESIVYSLDDLYPDALTCLRELRQLGVMVGLAGNQNEALEAWAREAESARRHRHGLGEPRRAQARPGVLRRPGAARRRDAAEVAYVGDRVDNDVLPALRAGLVAIHLRRGPWGLLQRAPEGTVTIDGLAELPAALASVP